MKNTEMQDGPSGGTNRDFGARQYGDMPSVNGRQWGDARGRDDSFGPPELGGYGQSLGQDGRAEAGRRDASSKRGRGPRNATRSDSLIAEELGERMSDDHDLDAGEIMLQVENGQVLLTGEVPERWMKHRAEDIADGVRGVREIQNHIRVDNGISSFGAGGPVRSGLDQKGSGFSSPSPNAGGRARD